MPVDPTIALAVNIAAAPRSMAFFLGAGVSVPAGIPSGREILEETCRLYYRAAKGLEPPDDLDIVSWAMTALGPQTVTYSQLLDSLFPSPAARQAYLRRFFEGKSPTEAHHCLAAMAAAGWIRVFITTNFDHLLEDALTEAGVSWSRVSSPYELATARPREHCDAYILKIHGDYMSSAIRNTPAELERLDSEIEAELQAILRNYGLVVIGYSGHDPGVQKVLRTQPARYGVFWVTKGSAPPELENLLVSLDARHIIAKDADTFCRDLCNRVEAVSHHPDGRTPRAQRAEVISLLRKNDDIGIQLRAKELAQRLIQAGLDFSHTLQEQPWYPISISKPDEFDSWKPVVESVLDALGPTMDAYIAAAIPVGEFRSPQYRHFVDPLPRMLRRCFPADGRDILTALAVLVGYSLMTAALLNEAWEMFPRTALAIDMETGRPWTYSADFHHLSLIGKFANHTGQLVQEWLRRSSAVREMGYTEDEVVSAAAQANLLLCVSVRANEGEDSHGYFWGILYGRRLDPLIRRIAFDDEAAMALAALTGGGAEQFRLQLHDRCLKEAQLERYFRYFPEVNREVLELLKVGSKRGTS